MDQGIKEFPSDYLSSPPSDISVTSYEPDSTLQSLSHEKSEELFDFIQHRLVGVGGGPGPRSSIKDGRSLLEGDRSRDQHLLSRYMMQYHIDNYWKYFHAHFPIRKFHAIGDGRSQLI